MDLKQCREIKWFCVSLLVVCLYLLPFFVLWEDAPVLLNDNLDNVMLFNKVLADSGQAFAPLGTGEIPAVMGGLQRDIFGSEFNPILWMYLLLSPFAVYVVNLVIMHVVALIGMFLLLKKYFVKDWRIALGVATAFALLPFLPLISLTIAGTPLALYALFNIRHNNDRFFDWLIVLFVPLFFDLVLGGFVFLGFSFALFAWDWFKHKRFNKKLLLAVVLLTSISFLKEYRLVYLMFFNPNFVSHRVEFLGYPNNFLMILGRSARSFIFSSGHSRSLHWIIALCVLVALAFQRFKNRFLLLLIFIIAAACLFGEIMKGLDLLEPLKANFSLLRTFGFGRVIFMLPVVWFIAFAVSLKVILKRKPIVAWAFIFLQIAFLFCYTEWGVQEGGIGTLLSDKMSYGEFYSTKLFDEIDGFIGLPKESYKVVSIGLHPAIAQYNRFYTVDSYQSNYPLDYKHRFRVVIEKELDKSPLHLKRYFDGWGSRCYVFVAELPLPYYYTKDLNAVVKNLELNTVALKELGGEFVFSSVEILNAEQTGLKLLKVFERNDSPWKIWLYKVEAI